MRPTRPPVHQDSTAASEKLTRRWERQVLRYIRQHGLVEPGQQLVVAVSGGPDSLCLLAILYALQGALAIQLQVAHFDHMLRGRQAAAADAALVESLAQDLGIPVAQGRGDVRAHARAHKLSLEEAGRDLRYRFLAEVARAAGAPAVAVGHTADDQAETVLMHILRGSGLPGLGGMQPRSPWPWAVEGEPLVLVRPLLTLTRAQTEAYCRARGLQPRRDPTNLSPGPLRNRIRLELLPLLRRYNPRVDIALRRLAEAAAEDATFLRQVANQLWPQVAHETPSGVALSRPQLAALHPALRKALLREAARRVMGSTANLTATHLAAMEAALAGPGERSVALPGRLAFAAAGASATLSRLPLPTPPALPEQPLNIPGQTRVADWLVTAQVLPREAFRRSDDPYEAYMDLNAVGRNLTVRSRRPGDRLRPLGLKGEKRLQDLLVDAKVPRSQRDAVALVCAPWGIAWVVGHRLDERAKVSSTTQRVLHLRFTPVAPR